MEGPLRHVLCEMKDFARAEYKLLCFGAFFARDCLLEGRRVEKIAFLVAKLGEQNKWKAPNTPHLIFSFLWKDTPNLDQDDKHVMFVSSGHDKDKNIDFVVTDVDMPPLPERTSRWSKRREKQFIESVKSSSLDTSLSSLPDSSTPETSDMEAPITPITPMDSLEIMNSSKSSGASITARFAAMNMKREDNREHDHRVASIFCHCKAGKGRGATITAATILCVHLGGEHREPVPYGHYDASNVITPVEVVLHIKQYRFHINVDGPKIQDLTLAYLHFLGLPLDAVDMFSKIMTSNAHSTLLRLHYRIVGKQQQEAFFDTDQKKKEIYQEYYDILQDYYTMACLLLFDSKGRETNQVSTSTPDSASKYPLTRRNRIESASTRELMLSITRPTRNADAAVDEAYSNHLSPLTHDMMTSNPPFHREVEICFISKPSNSLISLVMVKHCVFEAGHVFLAPFHLNGEINIRVIAVSLDGDKMRRFWLRMTMGQSKRSRGRIWRPRSKGIVKLYGIDGQETLRLRIPKKLWNDWVISVRLSRAWNQNVREAFDGPSSSCRREDDIQEFTRNTSIVTENQGNETPSTPCIKSPPMKMSEKSYRNNKDSSQDSRNSKTKQATLFSAMRRVSTSSPLTLNKRVSNLRSSETTPRTPPGVISPSLFLMNNQTDEADTLMNRMLRSDSYAIHSIVGDVDDED